VSLDRGAIWTMVNDGLTNPYVFALTVAGTSLFAGTDAGGVWRRPLQDVRRGDAADCISRR